MPITEPSADRFVPGASLVKLTTEFVKHPLRTKRHASGLAGELYRVARGESTVVPPRPDKRFKDPSWGDNWLFRRFMQTHLAVTDTVQALIDDADLDLQDERRLRFAAENVLDATAPSNFPWSNPVAIKTAIETNGASLGRGAANLVRDMRSSPRLPANTRESDFVVGEDLAATPGAVIARTEVYELIQYTPHTEQVGSVPVLFVPPMINKYYLLDLAPGRSLIEHLVGQGLQVFALSWRNPEKSHAAWNLDTYASAVCVSLDTITSIAGSDSVHLAGSCSGGALAAAVTAHLSTVGRSDLIASLMLAVCVIDSERAGVASAFKNDKATDLTVAQVAKKGYLDGSVLQGTFAWLRPRDLIWPYVVNNYLLGKQPPAFDILYWNADTTRLGAGLYRDLAELAKHNSLARPGVLTLLGTPIDLRDVTADTYIVAGTTDHITPRQYCYRTTQLVSGKVRFILSNSGHVAALVNPVANKKANYRAGDGDLPADADQWRESAEDSTGSWWSDWSEWLADRSGPQRPAPKALGNNTFAPQEPAPGLYVLRTSPKTTAGVLK